MAESHIRIDEGIKRGPKAQNVPIPANQTPQVEIIAFDRGRLANINPQSVLERYMAGETTNTIAKDYGVTRQGLSWWLRSIAEEDWKQAQVIQALERKDKAEEGLDTANDALSLARAREQLRGAQWELERVYNKIYAQKQELTGKDGGPLQVQIVRFGQVIEGETVSNNTPCAAITPQLPLIPEPTKPK